MKVERKHIITGILGLLVVLMVGGILITYIPPTNDASVSNKSVMEPIEPKIPSDIALPSDFALLAQSPSTTGELPLYRKTPRNRTESDIRDLAAKFGYTGKLSVETTKSGEIHYYSPLFEANNKEYIRWGSISGKNQDPALLPNDSEAGILADAFIESLGLDYKGAVRSSITHSQAKNCNSKSCNVTSERIGVGYQHYIDGYNFLPEYIYVYFGENGSVIMFSSRWNSFEKTENVTIISPSEAVRELQKKGVNLYSNDITSGTASITTCEIVYSYEDPNERTDTLVPLYSFKGQIQGSKGTVAWYQYVPATKGL